MNRFPDADQRADTVDGNATLTEVFAEMTQERGNADDHARTEGPDDFRMTLQRIETVADCGGSQAADALVIRHARDKTAVQRTGQEHFVVRRHSGGGETALFVIGEPLHVARRIDNPAGSPGGAG